jgi:hypothetical protein
VLTIAPTRFGAVYAAWRDGRVIAGRRADVERALATNGIPTGRHAGELPGPSAFATSALLAISNQPIFSAFIGVETTRWKWKMSWDIPAREQQRIAERKGLPHEPKFNGCIELEYASPADAAHAGQVIATNTFAIPLEEHLGAALAKLPQTVTGSKLTLRFTQDSFTDIELERLQAWLADLQAQAPR